MDKNIKYNNQDDQKIKELLSGTKLKAGDNLKYRIMQQIETEKALSQKARKTTIPGLGNMFSIFGIMYVIIAIIGFGVYSSGGRSALESPTFYIPVLLVAFIGGMFWMITCLDERRRSKDKKS